jgi:hypothetical protein
MNNHRFPVPLIPVTGKVLNGTNGPALFGDLYDLAGSVSIGLYDADTNAIATASGNGKVFFIGYSSEHTKDFLDKWMFGMQLPKGAPGWKFKGEDVFKFEYSDPQRVKAEKWVLGYDGSKGCNDTIPNFECGKVYGVRIVASGSPVFRRWAKTLEHEVFTDPICCGVDNCTTGCVDDRVDCTRIVKQLSERINNHVELAQIGVKARFLTNNYAAPSLTINKYTLTVKDDGSNKALGAVQLQVGVLGNVARLSYDNDTVTSVYEYYGTVAAASFVPSVSYSIADSCGVCASGFTTVASNSTYRVSRPLAGTEDLSSSVAKQTYADIIGSAYEVATRVTFNGTVAGVNVGTDTITKVAHGFLTGDKVTYANGGGTSITGLTSGNDYFVIKTGADTLKLASSFVLAGAGTAVDLTVVGVGVAHTLTPVIIAEFEAQANGNAIVDLKAPFGVELTALLSDSTVKTNSSGTTCSPAAATSIAWVTTAGVGYRSTRSLCISLNRLDCAGGNRLAELQAFYASNPLYVAASLALTAGDGCRDSYTLTQYADDFSTDGCLSSDTPVFSDFGGYDNELWTVVEPAVPAFDEARRCGIEITAIIPEKFYSDCAFEMNDYWEDEPIRLEVAWIFDSYTGFPEGCTTEFPAAKRTQVGQVANQSGEWLLREYIKAGAYENFSRDFDSPRLRERLDSNRRQQIDRKAFYRIYYIQANIFRKGHNFGQHPETVEAMIAFKEGDPKAAEFEAAFGSVLSKFDIALKKR